jgi:hypothetical protein
LPDEPLSAEPPVADPPAEAAGVALPAEPSAVELPAEAAGVVLVVEASPDVAGWVDVLSPCPVDLLSAECSGWVLDASDVPAGPDWGVFSAVVRSVDADSGCGGEVVSFSEAV